MIKFRKFLMLLVLGLMIAGCSSGEVLPEEEIINSDEVAADVKNETDNTEKLVDESVSVEIAIREASEDDMIKHGDGARFANDEYGYPMLIVPSGPITDLVLYSQDFMDTESEAMVLYTLDSMSADEALLLELMLPDFPIYKISYTDLAGQEYEYLIKEDMEDGHLLLEDLLGSQDGEGL